MLNEKILKEELLVGVDVGSTTTKIVAIDEKSKNIVFSDYRRHNAAQVQSVYCAVNQLIEHFPEARVRLALTGSGAKLIAESLDVPYIQEVVANSIALRERYDNIRTAIELGGQDAKMIFFSRDRADNSLNVADMRMNGSCAGGTGAFIDEVASILKVPIEEFNELAAQGTCVYDISGRCGVYAKTDIQPLLNQGVSKQDLALSAFHAIAKQTIGGLAQGLDIEKPVVFEGGPLTFNPTLIRVFIERLNLAPDEAIIPERPEIMIAYGAALSLDTMFSKDSREISIPNILKLLKENPIAEASQAMNQAEPFFASAEEEKSFLERHRLPECSFKKPAAGKHDNKICFNG